MYLPAHFAETRIDVLQRFIAEHPLGMLVTLGADGLDANHLPVEYDPSPAPRGTLRMHVARANPVWKNFSEGVEALLVLQGPQAYVSPSWYASKKETGKVVPTYNYMVVHAHGTLTAIEDHAWLRGLVERLTNRHESVMPAPWKVGDAPEPYVDQMLAAIVGLELSITRITGKWKLSQNRSASDRDGVARGLADATDPQAVAIAEAMKACKG